MGTTGAGSAGTTVSSPRGELSLGERVSDDDGDGFRLGERIARGSGGPLAFGPGVPAAGRAETGLAAGGLRFGGPDGGAPDPAVAAMVDRAFRAAAEGLELGFEAVAGLARATARGLGTAAAVARGDPSAVLEAVEAVAGAVRAAPAKAGQLGEVVDRAVAWVAERRDPRAHDDRGLPTAAEWARRVADWAGLPVEAGLATVERGVELAQDIPAARTPLARELARGVASGAATGAVADKSLELALELDARAAVEAFNGEGGGGRLGRALADQGLRSRTQALGAIAEGSLTGLDRTGALTVVMRETRLERDLNGRDGRGGVAEAEESLRSSVAEALVAAHLPGLGGPEREAATARVEDALARRSVRRELAGLEGLRLGSAEEPRARARPPTRRWWSRRAGTGRPARAGRRDRERPGRGRRDGPHRGAPSSTRTALTFGPDVSTLEPGSARRQAASCSRPRAACSTSTTGHGVGTGRPTCPPSVARRHGHEHDVSGHRLGPRPPRASGLRCSPRGRGARGSRVMGVRGHDRVCPPSGARGSMRPTGAFPERSPTSGSSWPQGRSDEARDLRRASGAPRGGRGRPRPREPAARAKHGQELGPRRTHEAPRREGRDRPARRALPPAGPPEPEEARHPEGRVSRAGASSAGPAGPRRSRTAPPGRAASGTASRRGSGSASSTGPRTGPSGRRARSRCASTCEERRFVSEARRSGRRPGGPFPRRTCAGCRRRTTRSPARPASSMKAASEFRDRVRRSGNRSAGPSSRRTRPTRSGPSDTHLKVTAGAGAVSPP